MSIQNKVKILWPPPAKAMTFGALDLGTFFTLVAGDVGTLWLKVEDFDRRSEVGLDVATGKTRDMHDSTQVIPYEASITLSRVETAC